MTTPLDEYLGTKTAAGFGQAFREAATNPATLGAVAGTSAMAAGLGALGPVAHKILGAITKGRDFRRMMELHPDLAQERERNPELFNQQYSSLRKLNPVFAADPVIAGTYMRQMSLSPEGAGKVLVESLGGVPRPTPMPAWAEAGLKQVPRHSPLDAAKFQAEAPMRQMQQQKLKNELEEYESSAPIRDLRRDKALQELQQYGQTP